MAIWKLEGLAIDGSCMSLGYITMQPQKNWQFSFCLLQMKVSNKYFCQKFGKIRNNLINAETIHLLR
jgi:hypothetical protein